jgi:hypothetical protein
MLEQAKAVNGLHLSPMLVAENICNACNRPLERAAAAMDGLARPAGSS